MNTSQGKSITEPQLDLFKRCELSQDDFYKIKKACDDEKIFFLSTPQNKSDLDFLLELGISAIKVGSDDFTNIPLLKYYSKTKLPIIDELTFLRNIASEMINKWTDTPLPKEMVEFKKTAFLSKSNSAFIEEMYMKFVNSDPTLPDSWKRYFDEIGDEFDDIVNEQTKSRKI